MSNPLTSGRIQAVAGSAEGLLNDKMFETIDKQIQISGGVRERAGGCRRGCDATDLAGYLEARFDLIKSVMENRTDCHWGAN